jgi:hypothetical protein
MKQIKEPEFGGATIGSSSLKDMAPIHLLTNVLLLVPPFLSST